jgi:CheY-like chemotaxis protein
MPRTGTVAGKRPRRAKRSGRTRARKSQPRTRSIEAALADIAHEIRTPLTGILALSDLLVTSDLGERERGWASALKSTAEHLASFTSLIVDAARADAKRLVLRRELIRPRRLADALAASLRARAEAKGLASEVHIAADLPDAVIGDPLRLRAAVENLVDNAVKFTERGSVRLDVSRARAQRGKSRLTFTLTDTGIGLTAAEIKRLFRPFAQANAQVAHRYGGAGLGLALVRRIARAMGGDLAVSSAPKGGSRFELNVMLDAVVQPPDLSVAERANALAAEARPLAVLCVEDNPYGRVLLNTILSELGHRADFVGTGTAAVAAAGQGRYDVVLMDVTLPDIEGVEAARRIRALDGDAGRVPIIGISGRGNPAEEQVARAAGIDGYVTKPLSAGALAQALTAVIPQPSREAITPVQ